MHLVRTNFENLTYNIIYVTRYSKIINLYQLLNKFYFLFYYIKIYNKKFTIENVKKYILQQ